MRKFIKKEIQNAAAAMPVRKTHIAGYTTTTAGKNRIYKGKRLASGFLSEVTYKMGFKPVDNARTLRKAYKRGGMQELIRVRDFYMSLK